MIHPVRAIEQCFTCHH